MNIKTKEFIEKTNIVHGDKYLYDEVEYINNKTKVCIICRDHGKFWQRPDAHLSQKQGCPICSRIESDKKRRYTIERWEQKAKLVHEGKYDYTKIVYQGSINKVCIICPEHGEFWQLPSQHLQGTGCPICNESKLEKYVKLILNNNLIRSERQKTFTWLKNDKTNYVLPLDFYLPDYNIAIECQGEQHFKNNRWFGCKDKNRIYYYFKEIQKRDKIKKELCKKNNLPLYYINYNDNVEEKLNEILKKCQ